MTGGLRCPRCGSPALLSLHQSRRHRRRQHGDALYRRRRCSRCGATVTTREAILTETLAESLEPDIRPPAE